MDFPVVSGITLPFAGSEWVLFIIGLLLLIKGGDWFVDGAAALAKRIHVPELLIGATVVSIGTTLPEVMVSATSAFQGLGEMAYGNAIGSIICNTALVAAVTIAVRPPQVDAKALRLPVTFFFIAAVIYAGTAYFSGYFSRPIGALLLAIFILYMAVTVRSALKHKESPAPQEEETKDLPLWKSLLFLVLGAGMIALGANLLVDNGTIIAKKLGVPDSVIALTFVALGTSLPELVTAITSLVKGHSALSLGNVIGANLFNLVLVCGVSILINPFDLADSGVKTIAGLNSSFIIDLPLMMLVMLILTVPALARGKLPRAVGIVLLALYAGFCVFQFAV